MPDISSLANEINDLTKSIGYWNTWIIVFMFLAAATATGLVISQRVAFKKAERLTIVTGQLSDLKESISAGKISDATVAAASAIKDAGKANERAGKADERAANAESGNLKLRTDLEIATAESTKRQAELEVEQRKTAEAQADAAKAQLALKQHVDVVAKRGAPRMVDLNKFEAALKGRPKAAVSIWYDPPDSESYLFALQIKQFLGTSPTAVGFEGAGWEVSDPQPIPPNVIPDENGAKFFAVKMPPDGSPSTNFQIPGKTDPNAPTATRFGGAGASGLTLLSLHPADDVPNHTDTALNALTSALMDGTDLGVVIEQYSALPEGVIVLVVGQKR